MPKRNDTVHASARVGLACSIAVVALAAVATASAGDRAPYRALTYTRAALSSAQGVESLYQRIVRAARAVCPPYIEGGLSALAEEHLVRQCRRKAVDDAVRRIGDSRLSSMEALRKGRR